MTMPVKVAIMQPYFFPYIGYWQLIQAVDSFVVYDNIEFTKKGWFHRNRFLLQGQPELFSLPLKKDSDFLTVGERFLSDRFAVERVKLARRIEAAYRKAPYFAPAFSVWQECLACHEDNLFQFLFHSIKTICNYLGITTPCIVASDVAIDHRLRGQDKVIAICQQLGARQYYNPIGGRALYQAESFSEAGLTLFFQQVGDIHYRQFQHAFQPFLSILDVMMFNSVAEIQRMLQQVDWLVATKVDA